MESVIAPSIECYSSRSRVRTTAKMAALWTLHVICIRLGLVGLAVGPVLKWTVWVVAALVYGTLVVVCFWLYFRRGPQVVLNEEGIEDRRQALGVIPWEDIRWFAINTLHEVEFLSIEVADPDKYLARLTWWNRFGSSSLVRKGLPAIAISFVHLDPSLDEVWQFICKHHPNLT